MCMHREPGMLLVYEASCSISPMCVCASLSRLGAPSDIFDAATRGASPPCLLS